MHVHEWCFQHLLGLCFVCTYFLLLKLAYLLLIVTVDGADLMCKFWYRVSCVFHEKNWSSLCNSRTMSSFCCGRMMSSFCDGRMMNSFCNQLSFSCSFNLSVSFHQVQTFVTSALYHVNINFVAYC